MALFLGLFEKLAHDEAIAKEAAKPKDTIGLLLYDYEQLSENLKKFYSAVLRSNAESRVVKLSEPVYAPNEFVTTIIPLLDKNKAPDYTYKEGIGRALIWLGNNFASNSEQENTGKPNDAQSCPYNLSGLKTIKQREHFLYVFRECPPLPKIKEELGFKTRQAWSRHKDTVNDNLSDSHIAFERASGTYKVFPGKLEPKA